MLHDNDMNRIRNIFNHIDSITDDHELPATIHDMLDHVKEDVEWLYDKLVSAWSIVEEYQEELHKK